MVKVVVLEIMLFINATWTARVQQHLAFKPETTTPIGGVSGPVTLSDGSPIVMLLCVFITFIYFTPFRELQALLLSPALQDVLQPSPAGTKQEQIPAA